MAAKTEKTKDKKAKDKKAKDKKAKARKATISVRDPHWWPLPKVYKLLFPQFGSSTGFELLEALKSGELRCMRRPATDPSQCEDVPASFWQDRQFDENSLYYHRLDIHGPNAVMGPCRSLLGTWVPHLDGNEFYVWEPEKVWLALAPQATKGNVPEGSERGRPGPRPTNEWQWLVTIKYYTEKYNDRTPPTAPELADICDEQIRFKPKATAINKLLRDLRKILGG
jgi:hypothetical protein